MAGSDVSVADLSVSVMVRHESDSVAFHLSSTVGDPYFISWICGYLDRTTCVAHML